MLIHNKFSNQRPFGQLVVAMIAYLRKNGNVQ